MTDAREVIAALGMSAHPEGGWYAETWRGSSFDGARPTGSAIVYLLAAGERSHWHRVDADEIWQYSAGDPLELLVWAEGDGSITTHRLSGEVAARSGAGAGADAGPGSGPGSGARAGAGSAVQAIVPAGAWQAARSLGDWTLVGCIVTPAFEFAGFELAPADWEPPTG